MLIEKIKVLQKTWTPHGIVKISHDLQWHI